jgi:putative protease
MIAKLKPKDIEIMAPVGSFESLMAAIQEKADSVYFGIGHLNMRSKSTVNFTAEDLKSISGICRENQVRSYITLNTVVFDDELDLVRKILDDAKESGIDAIIAADRAVIQFAREAGMEVHISTQANITNFESVKYYSRYADVMVMARELSLEQVKAITGRIKKERLNGPSGDRVRIEVFAHGALCMAVSGQCYLSLDNMNSSANRGACMQLCRRPYRVVDRDGEVELEIDNPYIMSPRDLKTIDFIDKILDAGVRVLKIEGRGRSPEYVRTVTRCYREAANSVCDGSYSVQKLKQWNQELGTVYNRGFWEGFYLGRRTGELSGRYGSQATKKKVYVGKIMNYYSRSGVAEIKIEARPLHTGDEVLVIGPTTGVAGQVIGEIWLDEKKVNAAARGDLVTVAFGTHLRPSDKLYKWVDADHVSAQSD